MTERLRLFCLLSVLLTAFAMLSSSDAADNITRKSKEPFGVKFEEATPSQLVYIIPAHIGGTIFTPVGAIVYWPFTAGANAIKGDFRSRAMLPPVQASADTFGTCGAYLLGGPFWCLKKAFWDFPIWIFSGSEDDSCPSEKEEADTAQPAV